MNRYYWILGGFAALVALLAIGLGLNPRDVPSPLVGKPAPTFNRPILATPDRTFGPGAACAIAMDALNCASVSQALLSTKKRCMSGMVAIAPPTARSDSER